MIQKEEYLEAVKEIQRLQKIIDQYNDENNPYKTLKLKDINIVRDAELHPFSSKYLSFMINDQEVQRITKVDLDQYKIINGRYWDNKNFIIKKTANFFKRKGMKVSVKDFREWLEPHFEYFEKD